MGDRVVHDVGARVGAMGLARQVGIEPENPVQIRL